MQKLKRVRKDKKTINKSQKTMLVSVLCISVVFIGILSEGIYGMVFADQASSSSATSASSVTASSSASSGSSKASSGSASSASALVSGKNITSANILVCMQPGLASAFATLEDAKWVQLSSTITQLSQIMDFTKPTTLTDANKYLLGTVLSQVAIDGHFFKGNALTVVSTYKKTSLAQLQETEKAKYSSDIYTKLSNTSQQFSATYKNAKSAAANQVILFNQSFKLNNPVINYNDTLMVSINDIYQFIDAKCYINTGSATLSIVSKDKRAEYVPGKNTVYVNDKSSVMDVAMLYVNGVYYIPVEFFAKTYSVGYTYLKDEKAIVLYNNLNQLSIPTTPNTLITATTFSSSSSSSSSNSSSNSSGASNQSSSSSASSGSSSN